MGVNPTTALSTVLFSVGRFTTAREVDRAPSRSGPKRAS
jgi:cysteine sulfinate desulfinase/cysteine desulfurase-like protein